MRPKFNWAVRTGREPVAAPTTEVSRPAQMDTCDRRRGQSLTGARKEKNLKGKAATEKNSERARSFLLTSKAFHGYRFACNQQRVRIRNTVGRIGQRGSATRAPRQGAIRHGIGSPRGPDSCYLPPVARLSRHSGYMATFLSLPPICWLHAKRQTPPLTCRAATLFLSLSGCLMHAALIPAR